MRLVSVSCDPNFLFAIDGHNMTIIEVDGITHKPLVVDSIQIFAGECLQRYYIWFINLHDSFAGQRYSFIVRFSFRSNWMLPGIDGIHS